MRFLSFGLLAGVFSLAIIMSSPGAGGKTDDKLIQGTWVVDPGTYAEVKDEKARKEALQASKSVRIIFDGERCIMKHPPGNEEQVFFRLDSTKKPKQIDFGEGAKGVYELEGDTLKLCWDQQAKTNGRPTKFSLRQEKDSVNYFILKREKKK
jgi:uncharacterized protein (TIGR03067 family)